MGMEGIRGFELQPVWRELCPIGQLLGRQNSPAARLPLFMHPVTEIG